MEGTISEGRKGRGGTGRKGPIYKRREGACYLVGFISKGNGRGGMDGMEGRGELNKHCVHKTMHLSNTWEMMSRLVPIALTQSPARRSYNSSSSSSNSIG